MHVPKAFFIAGTDTGVGKTVVAAGLLAAANKRCLRTLAIKPVAAGCVETPEGLRNDDALLLKQTMSMNLPYERVNPIALEPAIAPHIAAMQCGQSLQVSRLVDCCRSALLQGADVLVVEGAGGWRVPLNATETMADCVRELKMPVVLVVAMKLGCLNHALLTAQAITQDGLPLAGWVANSLGELMPSYRENINTLKAWLPAPCLGEVPYLQVLEPDTVADYLDLSLLEPVWLKNDHAVESPFFVPQGDRCAV